MLLTTQNTFRNNWVKEYWKRLLKDDFGTIDVKSEAGKPAKKNSSPRKLHTGTGRKDIPTNYKNHKTA